MASSRYSESRQKACWWCRRSKVKCDRKASGCSRCAARGFTCSYTGEVPASDHSTVNSETTRVGATSPLYESQFLAGFDSVSQRSDRDVYHRPEASATSLPDAQSPTLSDNITVAPTQSLTAFQPQWHSDERIPQVPSNEAAPLEDLDFSGLDLECPVNADDISNRWLNSLIQVPGQVVKDYPQSITRFIYRIIRSYAAMAVRGRSVLPFVHISQMKCLSAYPALATCLTVVRVCNSILPGGEDIVVELLMREMNRIVELQSRYDGTGLLAAFQAYLIYSMVLFFYLIDRSSPFLREAMAHLQELACSCCRRGVSCRAEREHSRPKWEAWIVAEATRRTLYTMYLFDSVLSCHEGLPTFLGIELQGLLAPSDKFLWREEARVHWNSIYNMHLVNWHKGGLRIDELWPMPSNASEEEIAEKRRRVDLWLEGVDEFGTSLYAITSCTHGT